MPNTNKSIATFAVLAVAGLLIATMFVFVAPIRPLQSAQAVVEEPPVENGSDSISLQVLEAGSFVQQTGNSAVKAEFTSKEVSMARGNAVTVSARIQHLGGANVRFHGMTSGVVAGTIAQKGVTVSSSGVTRTNQVAMTAIPNAGDSGAPVTSNCASPCTFNFFGIVSGKTTSGTIYGIYSPWEGIRDELGVS